MTDQERSEAVKNEMLNISYELFENVRMETERQIRELSTDLNQAEQIAVLSAHIFRSVFYDTYTCLLHQLIDLKAIPKRTRDSFSDMSEVREEKWDKSNDA